MPLSPMTRLLKRQYLEEVHDSVYSGTLVWPGQGRRRSASSYGPSYWMT
jgi:hypothetical protein